MALEVVYENMAVGVTGNVTNTANYKQDFVDMDELNRETDIKNYGTLEGNNWLLSDDVYMLPDDLETIDLGYWSTELSDQNGDFENDVVITRTYNGSFTSPAITFTFDVYNNIYAKHINTKYYRNNVLIAEGDFTPNASVYSCMLNVVAYDKIVITINGVNKASRFLRIAKIDDGIIRKFYKDEIKNLKIIEQISDTGESLAINTMDLDILAKGDIKILWQRIQALKVYNNQQLYGTFFVDTSSKTLNNYKIKTYDYVGMLENSNFNGGVYTNKLVTELVSEICQDLPYELDASYNNITVTGYVPICTCREALMQVAFAINAVVDTSRNDKIIIAPTPDTYTARIIEENRASGDATLKSEAPYTQIELTEHKYVQGGEQQNLYNEVLDGEITLTFGTPVYNLSISGGTLVESGNNYATIRGTGGTVTLTGYQYDDQTTIKKSINPLNTSNSIPNVKVIDKATLVNTNNSQAIIDRLEKLLYANETVNVKFIVDLENPEKCGDYITISTPEGAITGQIINMTYELDTNVVFATATIREVINE